MLFLVMNFHQLHHGIQIMRFYPSADKHAQRIAEKMERVVVFQEFGVFAENRALVGSIHVRFQFWQTVLTRGREEVIEHLQVLQIERLIADISPEHTADIFQQLRNGCGRIWQSASCRSPTQE